MVSVVVNGQVVPADQAVISVRDRGFRYGDGVFETITVHNAVPYQWEFHIDRLKRGLEALKIAFDIAPLKKQAQQLCKANQLTEGVLRIQVTRGIGSKGYLPDSSDPLAGASSVLETSDFPSVPAQTVTLWQSSYTKPSPKSLPLQFKLCQGLNSTLARMEAQENSCFDALLSNEQKHVCETSSGNIFWVKDKVLYTPALSCGVLEGCMRQVVLRLSPWRVQEVEATPGQLTRADAVFISNSVWKVLAVGELRPQGIQWKSEPLVAELHALIESDIKSYTSSHLPEWQ